MFLALAFGLFLSAPLILLFVSIGRTAMGISQHGPSEAPVAATARDTPAAPESLRVPMRSSSAVPKTAAPLAKLAPKAAARPAAAGGSRRDFFGDRVVANRPVTTPAAPVATAPQSEAPVVSAPIAVATDGTLLPFRRREGRSIADRPQFGARA